MRTRSLSRADEDVIDFFYVLPYNDEPSGSACNDATWYPSGLTLPRKAGAVTPGYRGNIAFPTSYCCGTAPALHELAHGWVAWFDGPGASWRPEDERYAWRDSAHTAHWGYTTMNKQGQTGGFSRAGFTCVSPAGRHPSPTEPCDDHRLQQVNPNTGSSCCSSDGTGAFSNPELITMVNLRGRAGGHNIIT